MTDIAAWVEAGGPGLADPPEILDLYTFRPSRRIQQELDHQGLSPGSGPLRQG